MVRARGTRYPLTAERAGVEVLITFADIATVNDFGFAGDRTTWVSRHGSATEGAIYNLTDPGRYVDPATAEPLGSRTTPPTTAAP